MAPVLTDLEQLVLLAVLQAGDEAYGAAVQAILERRAERTVSLGSLYNTLVRLEEQGLTESERGEPTPVRGGKAKRLFRVTRSGHAALSQSRAVLERMWEGIPPTTDPR